MNRSLLIGIVSAVLLVGAGVGAWMVFRPSSGTPGPSTPVSSNGVIHGDEVTEDLPQETGPSIDESGAGEATLAEQQAEEEALSAGATAVIPDEQVGTGAAPVVDGTADADSDGLTNDQETQQGTERAIADTDHDGLSDGEEVRTRRTDPKRGDTDGDGLTDGEEVTRWKSDPLNPDTDNDSYSDGVEVKGGYNPNGTGKL